MGTGFVSCSSDSENATFDKGNTMSSRLLTTSFKNDANPYDEVGSVYDELFDSYYTAGKLGGTVPQIITKVEAIADANANFNSLRGTVYRNVSNTRINYLLEHSTTCVNDVISSSSMSTAGKSSLTSFINFFTTYIVTEGDCEVIYQKVVNYENEVINNPLLTSNDKCIILTTTSVARYSVCRAKKKPKKNTDPDWTIFIGNIIASTEGAEYGSAEAVSMALVTGIAQN